MFPVRLETASILDSLGENAGFSSGTEFYVQKNISPQVLSCAKAGLDHTAPFP